MTEIPDNDKFQQVVEKLDPQSKLVSAFALEGGISARVTALEIAQPDGSNRKVVVRQYSEANLKRHSRVAAEEFRLLQLLHSKGLATAKPYYLDESGEIFSTPYIVVEYLEGKTEFAPPNLPDLILQLATQLSRIHEVDTSNSDLSFLRRLDQLYDKKLGQRPAIVDDSLDEGRIRDAVEPLWPFPGTNQPVLLHGDFWPGNVLWRQEQIVGVIDWEDAALGDPLADLANTRLEMLWAFGAEAMEDFTRQYQSISTIDFTNLPHWDLCAALRPAFQIADWANDSSEEAMMREKHRWFVNQAFEKLPTQMKEGNVHGNGPLHNL